MQISPRKIVSARKLDLATQCPICLNQYHDCIMNSTCGHSYCRACLGRLMSCGVHICPLCRENLKETTHNYALNDVIEVLNDVCDPLWSQTTYCTSEVNCDICSRVIHEGDSCFERHRFIGKRRFSTLHACNECINSH